MIDELIEKIKEKNAPVVVGLDPQLGMIPKYVLDEAIAQYGETLEAAAEAFWQFNKAIIDAVYEIVPAVKPQIAMYEALGLAGLAVFKKTIDYSRSKGLIVIGDIKRSDIGSTAGQYAIGHIGKITVGTKQLRPFDEDFVTVNPYLGTDSIKPFTDICKTDNKGLFILCKTSNPSSGELQDRIVDGKPLYEAVAQLVEQWGAELVGKYGYSDVGAVVGATYPKMGEEIRAKFPGIFILIPGYGAQGAGAQELAGFFDKNGLGGIVNSSRGIIAAYQKEAYAGFGERGFADASRQAALDMIADLNAALGQ